MKPSRLFGLTILVRLLFTVLALLADNLAPDYDNSMLAEVVVVSAQQQNDNSRSSSSNNEKDYFASHEEGWMSSAAGAGGGKSRTSRSSSSSSNNRQRRVFSLLDPLMRWDAVHFRHIAKHGYTHEHLCAFFPEIGNIFSLFGLVSTQQQNNNDNNNSNVDGTVKHNLYQTPTPSLFSELSFLAFHILCSGISALFLRGILLDLLSIFVVHAASSSSTTSVDDPHSTAALVGHSGFVLRGSTIVWLLNPAAVFFTAAYTETYFALTSFCGIWCVHRLHRECGFFFSPPSQSASAAEAASSVVSAASDNVLLASLHRRIVRGTTAKAAAAAAEAKNKKRNTNNRQQDDAKSEGGCSENLNLIAHHLDANDAAVQDAPPQEVKSPTAALEEDDGKMVEFRMVREEKGDRKEAAAAENDAAADDPAAKNRKSPPTVLLVRCICWIAAATAAFALGTRFRSNGILCCGFFLHFGVLSLWFHRRAAASIPSVAQRVLLSLACVAATVVVLLPYHFHVQKCYKSFCGGAASAKEFQEKLLALQPAADVRYSDAALCSKGPGGYYSGVQHKYWKVGLFEYYTANNIPNFFISAPTFLFCTLGLIHLLNTLLAGKKKTKRMSGNSSSNSSSKKEISASGSFLLSIKNFLAPLSNVQSAHLVYLFAQLVIALTIMNVQVVTRFVSSTPALYLLYGFVIGSARASAVKDSDGSGVALLPAVVYSDWAKGMCVEFCVVWALVGTAMFPNFMPWT